MDSLDTSLANWAIEKVKNDYCDDICLLLQHKTLRLEKDMDAAAFGFYIPATNRANGLARTFMINGIGHDLFPTSWERIERLADLMEYNTTCLADADILWARSDEDRQRFVSLQARLQANLRNPQHVHDRAQEWYERAKDLYQDTLFEDKLYKVRKNAGYVCDLLSIAVALVNQRYFRHGQTDQIHELRSMEKLPENFVSLYDEIVREASPDGQKRLCSQMLRNTSVFLDTQVKRSVKEAYLDFSELAVWYQELSYTWRRVYHWCDRDAPVNAYMWCCMLQNEVDEWGDRFGISDIDILGSFNSSNLGGLRKRAESVEQQFRKSFEVNGVRLDEYETVEDFLLINS